MSRFDNTGYMFKEICQNYVYGRVVLLCMLYTCNVPKSIPVQNADMCARTMHIRTPSNILVYLENGPGPLWRIYIIIYNHRDVKVRVWFCLPYSTVFSLWFSFWKNINQHQQRKYENYWVQFFYWCCLLVFSILFVDKLWWCVQHCSVYFICPYGCFSFI